MSDDSNRPGDEPTQAYRAYNDDATQAQPAVPPYDPESERQSYAAAAPAGAYAHSAPPQQNNPGIVAPLVTVALLAILLGIGVGYLLFHDSSKVSNNTTTTTTAAPTTTVAPVTSTTLGTTSTLHKATTTTEKLSTSTSTTVHSSTTATTAKSTSTTLHTATTLGATTTTG